MENSSSIVAAVGREGALPLKLPGTQDIVQCSLLLLVVYMGVVGNVLMFVAVYRHKQFHTSSYYLLVSLGASDIGFLVTAIKQKTVNVFHLALTGDYLTKGYACKSLAYLYQVSWSTNIMTMLLISLNRYIHVMHPHLYQKVFTKRATLVYIIATWSLSFIVLAFAEPFMSYNQTIFACGLNFTTFYGVYSRILGISPLFTLPIIFFCYASILIKLRFSKLKVAHSVARLRDRGVVHMVNGYQRRGGLTLVEYKLLIQFGIICAIFTASWGLYGFLQAFHWARVGSLRDYPWLVLGVLLAVNSAINPIVYYAFNGDMRRVINDTVRCCCCYCKLGRQVPTVTVSVTPHCTPLGLHNDTNV